MVLPRLVEVLGVPFWPFWRAKCTRVPRRHLRPRTAQAQRLFLTVAADNHVTIDFAGCGDEEAKG